MHRAQPCSRSTTLIFFEAGGRALYARDYFFSSIYCRFSQANISVNVFLFFFFFRTVNIIESSPSKRILTIEIQEFPLQPQTGMEAMIGKLVQGGALWTAPASVRTGSSCSTKSTSLTLGVNPYSEHLVWIHDSINKNTYATDKCLKTLNHLILGSASRYDTLVHLVHRISSFFPQRKGIATTHLLAMLQDIQLSKTPMWLQHGQRTEQHGVSPSEGSENSHSYCGDDSIWVVITTMFSLYWGFS